MSGAMRPATSLMGASSGKRVVLVAHGLVGDGHVAGGDERVGALRGGGQVQVGEERLVLPRARAGGTPRATGSFTLQTRSAAAHTSSAVSTIFAPVRTKSASGMDEPSPAPFWT